MISHESSTVKRNIRAIPLNRFLRDFRAGLNDGRLMKEYGLPAKTLGRFFVTLVEQRHLRHEELYETSITYKLCVDTLRARRSPRKNIPVAVRIYNHETAARGFIRDVSEGGLRIAGMDARVGETMIFFVPSQHAVATDPFEFEAVCRWTALKGKEKTYPVAGFEITNASAFAAEQLRRLQDMVQVEDASATTVSPTVTEILQTEAESHIRSRADAFAGTVAGIDIIDFVQFMLLSGKKIVVRVEGPSSNTGILYFDTGRLVHAVSGSLRGNEAFLDCMSWPSGNFSTQSWSEPDERSIDLPGDFLLLEAARRRDDVVFESK